MIRPLPSNEFYQSPFDGRWVEMDEREVFRLIDEQRRGENVREERKTMELHVVYVKEVDGGYGEYVRLCGVYADRRAAEKRCGELKQAGGGDLIPEIVTVRENEPMDKFLGGYME